MTRKRQHSIPRRSRVQSPLLIGPACRAGLSGHAATSDVSGSKGRPRGDVERMCDLWRFAVRRKSFPADSSLPTFSLCALESFIQPQRRMMESWERFIAAGSRRDLAPADPASVEPRSGNYKRTQFMARPPSASRRWSQGLTFWSPNLRSTGVKPDGADAPCWSPR